jgi:hypothetical protein
MPNPLNFVRYGPALTLELLLGPDSLQGHSKVCPAAENTMFGALNKKILAALKDAAMERPCPNCGEKFKPFADREITSLSDLSQRCTCPACRASFTLKELAARRPEEDANPEGPFQRPADSRVERRGDEAGGRVEFHVPSAGRWGLWVIVPIVWNLFALPAFAAALSTIGKKEFNLWAFVFYSLFAAVGVRIALYAIRHRYGSTTLELRPETIRLQRSLFRTTSSREVATPDVLTVSKVVAYTRNYQPVHAIEIRGDRSRIRFGSSLTDDEKNWLCWEVREYVRIHGWRVPIDPAVQILTRR